MILIDVGNTNIVFAASANNLLKKIKRIKTNDDNKKLKNLINKIIIDFASTNKLDNKFIVFTGALTQFTRQEARELVESNGGKVSSSISKKTSYLVSGEKSGSKLDMAKKLNVTILSETELLKLIQ